MLFQIQCIVRLLLGWKCVQSTLCVTVVSLWPGVKVGQTVETIPQTSHPPWTSPAGLHCRGASCSASDRLCLWLILFTYLF